jgi:hypothetical protein
VWEWNESILYEHYRNVRGGSFDGINNQQTAGRRESLKPVTYEDYELGFRVVQVPELASLSLLAICGLALLRRKSGYGG